MEFDPWRVCRDGVLLVSHYPRGSEWRKWDLHVHTPGTKLSDGYGTPVDWERFCDTIEASDVAVFGITDYFAFDTYLRFTEEHSSRYPKSSKTFLPNLELRLNEVVNGANQQVDIHLILRPQTSAETLWKLLAELKTEIVDSNGRNLRCSDLKSADDYNKATVTREDISRAIEETFGKAIPRSENVVLVVPSNNNGIRAASGHHRKANLADRIDALCDAIFGNELNREWFLKRDRYEDSESRPSVPKPVFAGSDAHSFEQLNNWLGRTVSDPSSKKGTTWIKADPTFEGLLQTLIEPDERVRIQPIAPDQKDQFKYIQSVSFGGTTDFPQKIDLNPNLVSIIGSRSSGKSALLAYIAHSVDPKYTIEQQVAAFDIKPDSTGPAAGLSWQDVNEVDVSIEWGNSSAKSGKVIYIPQNSLYKVSERPEEITSKIQPLLTRLYPDLDADYQRMLVDVDAKNATLDAAAAEWFRLAESAETIRGELRTIGDKQGIQSQLDESAAKLSALHTTAESAGSSTDEFEQVVEQLARAEKARTDLISARAKVAPYVQVAAGSKTRSTSAAVTVEVTISPTLESLPEPLAEDVRNAVRQNRQDLLTDIQKKILSYLEASDQELETNQGQIDKLRSDHVRLKQLSDSNTEIEELVNKIQRLEVSIKQHELKTSALVGELASQAQRAAEISDALNEREQAINAFKESFGRSERVLEGMQFGVEAEFSDASITEISAGFNRQENTEYFARSSEQLNINAVQQDAGRFLQQIYDGTQKVKRSQDIATLARKSLTLTPEVRFSATLDGDRIGGFSKSSMTPGKQALFALTLILNESSEGWPLLIDQPEDDLDSRSIYDSIVPYLLQRKRDRQILMVTHNANLVVGADSEQVVVANRHGQDRKNRDGATFRYLTGSLEYSSEIRESPYTLEMCGVREHACQILDGGELAFQKRKNKYNIR